MRSHLAHPSILRLKVASRQAGGADIRGDLGWEFEGREPLRASISLRICLWANRVKSVYVPKSLNFLSRVKISPPLSFRRN